VKFPVDKPKRFGYCGRMEERKSQPQDAQEETCRYCEGKVVAGICETCETYAMSKELRDTV
jgi:hypothetical protein